MSLLRMTLNAVATPIYETCEEIAEFKLFAANSPTSTEAGSRGSDGLGAIDCDSTVSKAPNKSWEPVSSSTGWASSERAHRLRNPRSFGERSIRIPHFEVERKVANNNGKLSGKSCSLSTPEKLR